MGKLWTALKWATKLGVAGGVLHVSDRYRLWGDGDEARRGLGRLATDFAQNEYVRALPSLDVPKEIADVLPKEMREFQLPNFELCDV
jgi:hypothetical protein